MLLELDPTERKGGKGDEGNEGRGDGEALARLEKKLLEQKQTLEVMHSLLQRLVQESESRISTLVRPCPPPSLPPSPVGHC
jgi:hypothetical protein